MRIIGGDYRGKTIKTHNSFNERPTTDYARESLFNILNNSYYFDDIKVLDLFAGTGAISYEFMSRGTREIMAVDMNKKYTDFIEKHSMEIFKEEIILVITADGFEFIKNHPLDFDVIFADPPYKMEKIDTLPDLVFANKYIKEDTLFILEHSKYYNFRDHKYFQKEKKYGHVHFTFFEKK